MATLDEKFNKCIKENSERIEENICHIINEEELCPCYEGVPCTECLKYALEILLK